MYHAVFAHGFDGGIMVTGSHNPADENGLKMVRGNAVPISGDSGLFAIRDRVAADPPCRPDVPDITRNQPSARPIFVIFYPWFRWTISSPFGSWPTRATDAPAQCCALWRLIFPLNLSCFTTNRTALFPHGIPIPSFRRNGKARPGPCGNIAPISGWPGTAISTVAFFMMLQAASSKAIIWWA